MTNPFEILEQKLDKLIAQQHTKNDSVRPEEEEPIDFKEACAHLKMGRTSLNMYVKNELVPHHRIIGHDKIKFFKSELNSWVKNGGKMKIKTQ